MDVDVIINADNRSWYDAWLPIHRHADMAHQSFINNAVDDAAVISAAFRTPADTRLVGDCDCGHVDGVESGFFLVSEMVAFVGVTLFYSCARDVRLNRFIQ